MSIDRGDDECGVTGQVTVGVTKEKDRYPIEYLSSEACPFAENVF